MIRRFSTVLAATAAAAILAGALPAAAHAPTFHIAGYQYLWVGELEGGHAGKLGVPIAGPVDLDVEEDGIGPARTNVEDGIDEIVNDDPVPHTFTECAVGCDTANPAAGADPAFDIALAAGTSSRFVLRPTPTGPRQLEARTYTFFCRVHPFMRGELTVSA